MIENKEERQHQVQQLANRLGVTLQVFHDQQQEAGTPMVANDALYALAHVAGSLLSTQPEAVFDSLYYRLGKQVATSYHLHVMAARLKADAEADREAHQEEAVQ